MFKFAFLFVTLGLAILEAQAKVWDKETILERTLLAGRKHGLLKHVRPPTPKQKAFLDRLAQRDTQESVENAKIRKEIRQMTTEERLRYANAVNTINTMVPDEEDGRTVYQLLVSLHPRTVATSAHFGAALMPWHREFMWRVEKAVQSIDPEVTLPYWDSAIDQKLPRPVDTILFSDYLIGTNSGPVRDGYFANFSVLPECLEIAEQDTIFRTTDRLPVATQKKFLWSEEDIDFYFLNHTTFAEMAFVGNFFERSYHDEGHVFAGGTQMNIDCSPSDPWFFLHHVFLDFMWETFRQNYQVTPIDQEYPDHEDQDIGEGHGPYEQMYPFNLVNIHGISTHYTDYYYNYAPRLTSCESSADCISEFLWCNTNTQECWTKIREGGVCEGMTDEACYGDDLQCIDDECVRTV